MCFMIQEAGTTNAKNTGARWSFRSEMFTLFPIESSRGWEVLFKVLGEESDSVPGREYLFAYGRYVADCVVPAQFCVAHMIRWVKFLLTLPDQATQSCAQRLLSALRKLFRVIHRWDVMIPKRFGAALERGRNTVLKVGRRVPARRPEPGRPIPHYLQSRERLQTTLQLCGHTEQVDMVDRPWVSS